MARVIRTAIASADLKQIARYIAKKSESRSIAIRFLDAVERRLHLHATQPEMGQRRPDLGDDVRHFSIGHYVVFYRPVEAGIEVLRIVHGSRDVPSPWWKPGREA